MSKTKAFLKSIDKVLKGTYNALYGFVFHSFQSINQKFHSKFPIDIGNLFEIPFPFYGAIGYLTHLKVDKIW